MFIPFKDRNRTHQPFQIPKNIHFIWLGNQPMPKISDTCINSWKTLMPDYTIKIWNDWDVSLLGTEFKDVFDYEKVYSFKCDVLRVAIINKFGGIYSDLDLELLTDIRPYIKYMNFFGAIYRPTKKFASVPLGSIPNHIISRTILNDIKNAKNNPTIKKNGPWIYYRMENILETYKPAHLGAFTEDEPVEGDNFVHYAEANRESE